MTTICAIIKLICVADMVLKSLISSDETEKLEANKELEAGLTGLKNIANDAKQQLKTDKSQE